jgi:site-specific recombinase XerD
MIPLFCRITVDRKEVRFSMKCDVNPEFWDVKAGKAIGRTVEAMKINSLIENTTAAIYTVYRELQERDNYVTAERVRNVFLGGETKQQTLLGLFDQHNKDRKLLIGVSLCAWNHRSYIRTRERLADFLYQWRNISDIPLKELDHRFICDFEAYLTKTYGLAHNTLTGYLKKVRYIIGVAMEKDYISKNPFSNFKMRFQNPDRNFLTQEEVEKLIAHKSNKSKFEQTRDVFLFCCFTGLSHSDVFSLTKDDIQLSFDNRLWIKGRRQKTDTEYNIPLLNIPKAILEKYENQQQGGRLLPVPEIRNYNYRLKTLGNACEIDKPLTSHLARHTFATTITLTKGVPIETVSKMLGHTDIKTTQIYAKVINDKISNDMSMLSEKLGDMEKLAVNF